jgi:hypothetical protein
MRAVTAGATYFAVVFAVGWAMGPIRELWALPRFGAVAAALLEAPVMLVAMIAASRWALHRFAVREVGARIAVGLVALALLLVAEVLGTRLVRGLSLADYLAGFATMPGLVSLLMFILFAAMPTLVPRRGR